MLTIINRQPLLEDHLYIFKNQRKILGKPVLFIYTYLIPKLTIGYDINGNIKLLTLFLRI